MNSKRILWFGGSFNPVGNHHLLMAELAREMGCYDEVVLFPCYIAAHRVDLIDFEHRFEMCRQATCYHGSHFSVSRIEQEMYKEWKTQGLADYLWKSYTIETVKELKNRGEKEVHLLIGADSMGQIDQWHGADQLVNEASFVVSPRIGWPNLPSAGSIADKMAIVFPMDELPIIDVSSTLIRSRCLNEKSIRFYVPRAVEEYIGQHSLYKGVPHVG